MGTQARTQRQQVSQGGRRGVLLVDDEPHVTKGLALMLRSEPYRVWTAHSADEALIALSAESVDILVTDEKMPGMSGSCLLAEVRRLHPSVVSLMLSGEATLDSAIRAINEGEVYRFFKKPVDRMELVAGIQSAIFVHDMICEIRRLRRENESKDRILRDLEARHPGITSLSVGDDGALILDGLV
ncbi:MAG: response regulator [Planctomycetes bacterium]|nr:response regulator [Planctomycetota bacterium]